MYDDLPTDTPLIEGANKPFTNFREAADACWELMYLTRQKNPDIAALDRAVHNARIKWPSPDAREPLPKTLGPIEEICAAGNQRNALVQALETGSVEAVAFLIKTKLFSPSHVMKQHEGNNLSNHPIYPVGTRYIAVAAQAHKPECLELLRGQGFDLSVKNPRGQTALDYTLHFLNSERTRKAFKESDLCGLSDTVAYLTAQGIKFTTSPFEKPPAERVKEFFELKGWSGGRLIHKIEASTTPDTNPLHVVRRAFNGLHP